MSTDLSRWNRSGLKRLEYVDGNALTYAELLRGELAARFNQDETRWLALEQNSTDGITDATELNTRMQAFYNAETVHDMGLEIARTLARSGHMLGAYINAYANENYLGTATQWENVRRMVAMLDYHPTPPASAATTLVLYAKDDRSGTVNKGELQVKHTPIDGSPAVVFENLEDIDVDPRNNALRLQGWNRCSDTYDPFTPIETSLWHAQPDSKLSVGQFAVLVDINAANRAVAVRINDLLVQRDADDEIDSLDIQLERLENADGQPWLKGYSILQAVAADTLIPHLNGASVVVLDRDHGLSVDSVVAWIVNGAWTYARVSAAETDTLELLDFVTAIGPGEMVPANVLLHKTALISRSADGRLIVPGTTQHVVFLDSNGQLRWLQNSGDESDVLEPVNLAEIGQVATMALKLTSAYDHVAEVYLLTEPSQRVGRIRTVAPTTLHFDGKPGRLASGHWCLGVFAADADNEQYQALKIAAIRTLDGGFALEFEDYSLPVGDGSAVSMTVVQLLQTLQMALDNEQFAVLTINDVSNGALAGLPVTVVQGIGSTYAEMLPVTTVADLALLPAQTTVAGLSSVRLWEFIAKARSLNLAAFTIPEEIDGLTLATIVQRIITTATVGNIPLTQSAETTSGMRMTRLYCNFNEQLRPEGFDINTVAITHVTESTAFNLSGSQFSVYLKSGRRVMLEQLDATGYHDPVICTVNSFITDAVSHTSVLTLRDLPENFDDLGFTHGNLVMSANVVRAGHGVQREVKVLGSGNAAALNQSFVLEVDDLSFIADPAMPKGVRADIEVDVGGRIWQQVASLRDSRPSDAHYEIRMTEEKYLRILFGDGVHGRRLPTGNNNVRVGFRSGHGLRGNIPLNSLTKLAKPHRYIEDFRQPFDSVGGNDMENIRDIKTNAPLSIVTIERAVSLNDFANLAQSQASVWQARAVRKSDQRGTLGRVKVIVVPANGLMFEDISSASLSLPSEFASALQQFLGAHAQPGVGIEVAAYTPVIAGIIIKPYIKSAEYDLFSVADTVKAAVLDAFQLMRRKLGQALYLSEVYKVVEAVAGVEYSVCSLLQPLYPQGASVAASAQVVNARREQVIYVDELNGSVIDVIPQEYEL